MAIASVVPARLRAPIASIGGMYTLTAEAFYWLFADAARARFQFWEFIDRCWFLIRVTLLPAALVAMPLGVSIGLQVGALAKQLGATSFLGAANALAIIRQASPLITTLILSGVGGAAICAELGARTIREEIDAMEVLGINPVQRLVAPLMAAGVVVAATLNLIVMLVGTASGYAFTLGVLGGTKGSFIGSYSQLAGVPDFIASELKACVFGATAVTIAAHKGLTAKKGPTGVGEAVNQSVVITGVVMFAQNLIMTQLFFVLVDVRTF